MELVAVSKNIEEKIEELELLKTDLPSLAFKKATTKAEYEKHIALTTFGLRNGKEYSLNGELIKEESASLIDKLARGICCIDGMNMDLADSQYKNQLKAIEITCSQLNGFQSINRHLNES